MSDNDERCFLCVFFNGTKCTHTWRLSIHMEPTGGQIDFTATPGMIPEELMPKVNRYFGKFIEKLLPAIQLMPIWDEIRAFQMAKEERKDCPGRHERADIKPYLKVVTHDMK